MGTRRVAVLTLLACLTLAGCAAGGTPSSEVSVGSTAPGSSAAGSTPTGSTPPSSTPAPTLGPTGKAPSPDPFPGAVTVRGTVREGVEMGCMILAADDGKSYLLLGGDRAVIGRGGRLEVVGSAQPGLLTTCSQGIPFKVSQVRAI